MRVKLRKISTEKVVLEKKLTNSISIRETASKVYVDKKFTDPSIIKNTAHVDFNVKNLDKVRFVQVYSLSSVSQQLTAMQYVDDAINESTLVRINEDNDFNNYNLTNINSKHYFKY